MPKVAPIPPQTMMRYLDSLGFVKTRQKGSHIFFRHPDGKTTTVPYHKGEELRIGIVLDILKNIGVEKSDFEEWLNK